MPVPNRTVPEVIFSRPSITRFTAPNPGPKTLDGTNSYLVGSDSAYVIDPGPMINSYQEMLAEAIHQARATIAGIVITHRHPDHAPGALHLQSLLSVPILGPAKTSWGEALSSVVDQELSDGDRLPVDGDCLLVLETPGHTPDHLGLWLEHARVLFAGDTILGRGTTLIAPPEGNMRRYLDTLVRLQSLEPVLIGPGHGPIITEPATKLREYIEHRQQREQEIIAVLRTGKATTNQIVQQVYVDIHADVRPLAESSVRAQLEKLVEEGIVTESAGLYRLSGIAT
jgi:glyoxylase-like metal-dependent hydrolase (beta-lactamase superfamily II)